MQKHGHYIGGEWRPSAREQTFEAISPATGEVLAHLAEGTVEDADRAVRAANDARARLSKMSVWDRSRMCLRIADAIDARKESLARTLTLDQGKPYHSEALGEVQHAAASFRNCAEQIKWLETAVMPVEAPTKRVFSIRQPRGVYAIVTPWNFPYMIAAEYLAPGLAAGNAMVWVPAPTTSLCAVEFVRAIAEADLPPGAINLVTGPGAIVGDAIVAHPGTHGVGFTGSPPTGEQIMRRAAGKPCLLELGGNGPTIILDDADIDAAAAAAALGCWFNAGQVCSATERILVHERAHDAVVAKLAESARAVKLGDPFDPKTTMGPLNNEPTAVKSDRHVKDAVERGASLVFGGGRADGHPTSLYYGPTVLDGVTREMAAHREETFGPVAKVMTVSSDDEALRVADDSELGLVSAVFTRDLKRAFRFSEALRTGIVVVNDFTDYWELHLPFGGASGKRSGIGRIGGKHAIMEMTDLKTIVIDIG
ncbi:MAG: aldehyde dehydrogenase family protein [Myxococcota bacterium]|nr:aldehyde dehydrogenase family protein [Myxococcota bacterium]